VGIGVGFPFVPDVVRTSDGGCVDIVRDRSRGRVHVGPRVSPGSVKRRSGVDIAHHEAAEFDANRQSTCESRTVERVAQRVSRP